MPGVLSGLRVIEVSAFVAVPLGGLTLAQLGADVIRVDPLGGGLDYRRWPITSEGASLYWAGLNKGKRSVALDVRSEEGRNLVRRLVTAPGADAGILITNLAPRWMGFDELQELRPDLIMVTLSGNSDGTIAVDYTVNAAIGFPGMTGQGDLPVNHVLPAWDVIAGHAVAMAVLAAERHRSRTGEGQLVELALSDIALGTLGHLGFVAEVEVNNTDRSAHGNHVYGTYGKDFLTADGDRVMVVALTTRQWRALLAATETTEAMAALERVEGRDLATEADRFLAKEKITALLEPWFAARSLGEVAEILDGHRVCWGPYQTVRRLLQNDARASVKNPMFQRVAQPGVGTYLTPASPLQFGAVPRVAPQPAPLLGADTVEVLGTLVGIGEDELAELQAAGVIERV